MRVSLGLQLKVKDLFFDRPKVQRAADRAERKILSKAGAFVRKRARSSLRRRKRVSRPGQPPSVHSTEQWATLKFILFAYEPNNASVVIGPVLLNGRPFLDRGQTVPEILEKGGVVRIKEKQVAGRWVSMGRRKPRAGQPVRARRAQYEPRPFMAPALEAEASNFPDLWRNSVRAA